MRHTTVLQRGEGGPFHYVSASRDGGYPTEGCTADCTHATADEAYEHHRLWLLDMARYDDSEPDTMRRCEACDEWTQRRVHWGYGGSLVLCDLHATREVLEARALPPGTQINSWGSG